MKVLTVVGARPQFIKAAAVSRRIAESTGLREVLVHTGQHYDDNMSDLFFRQLGIPKPSYHLGVGSGGHGVQTGRMLEALEPVLIATRPDWVLVYGDTNSTLAGALAAAKLHIRVAHIESGLRSFNRTMPEEINRIVADHVADLLFAPTTQAAARLSAEGITGEKVRLVGDVMYDAALFFAEKAEAESRILRNLDLRHRGYVLATVHRAENTNDPDRLRAILGGLSAVAETIPVVLPLHPRTRSTLGTPELAVSRALRLIDPIGYLDMVSLERHAAAVATDSGGVQKEAFFYRIPCVTLRNETEWTELLDLGWNRLAPPRNIETVAESILDAIGSQGQPGEPYGDGRAASHIVNALLSAQ